MTDDRPDPEVLLSRVKEEETRKTRGRFRVFFGASAGVGKTYAMLEESRLRRGRGVDVVAGWVETHGRSETQALLEGLEILPPREYTYRGTTLREFDLDAALKRHPQILLLDELAHTNAPGARHAKRWQDVEEILSAGIDVYSTVNVQHIESLNDIIAQTTGVVVRETVPDHVLEMADQIELIDLTPEDLLERLKEGKVYIPDQAERALHGFFSRGNLIALRELALRRAAERVDAELRTYKDVQGVAGVWPVTERILVCISPSPAAARVVRAAARMAHGLRAEWIVAHVEKPGDLKATESDRHRTARTLNLAEELGAEHVVLTGQNVSDEILAYARRRNVTKIVVGKPSRASWRYRLFGSVVDALVRQSADIDVYVIRGAEEEETPFVLPRLRRHSHPRAYAWSILAVAVTTGLCLLLYPHFAPVNLVMIYLGGVVFVASILGRGPALLASGLSVAAFDLAFVPPRWTFAVSDGEYLVTFGVMLTVALVISQLTVRLRQQADAHRRREERTAVLYRLSREFSHATGIGDIISTVERQLGEVLESEIWVLLSGADGELKPAAGVTSIFPLDPKELAVADWVHKHGQPAGLGTTTLSGARALYLPLLAHRGAVGVLGLFPNDEGRAPTAEQMDLIEALAGQITLVVERTLLAEEAQNASVRAETERLRSLLLSSVSHDLRTPLATITGAASGLLEGWNSMDEPTRLELTRSILEGGERLNRLVANLLSMTRIEAGGVRVKKEWQPVEEVIGAALNTMEKQLQGRSLSVRLPEDLPLVPLDGVLIDQVLVNLLENAVKYTPEGSPIEVSAWQEDGGVTIEVADRGPGIRPGDEEHVFDKFYRGPERGDRPGVGLGLPICRGMVEAHGGRIWALNRPDGGASFRFNLPSASPPPLEPNES